MGRRCGTFVVGGNELVVLEGSVADEDEADDEDGGDGGAQKAHHEVAESVVVAVGICAPGGACVSLALEFVNHDVCSVLKEE